MSSIPVRASDGVEPPPESFNFAGYLLAQNIHRPGKPAFIDDTRTLSYGVLDERVRRMASGLRDLGIKREERVLLLMQDTNDWPVAFLGAIYAGIVPVPVNTRVCRHARLAVAAWTQGRGAAPGVLRR
jgi:benzoate-CoA ligase